MTEIPEARPRHRKAAREERGHACPRGDPVGLASGCGSSIIGPASTTPPAPHSAGKSTSTTTTAPLTGEVAVAFPVVACTTSSGQPLHPGGWSPTILLAPIPTALVGKVEFYSDGVHTVLGPSGWTCSQESAARGPPVWSSPLPVPQSPGAGAPGGGDRRHLRHLRQHRHGPGHLLGLPVLHHSFVAEDTRPTVPASSRRANRHRFPRRTSWPSPTRQMWPGRSRVRVATMR